MINLHSSELLIHCNSTVLERQRVKGTKEKRVSHEVVRSVRAWERENELQYIFFLFEFWGNLRLTQILSCIDWHWFMYLVRFNIGSGKPKLDVISAICIRKKQHFSHWYVSMHSTHTQKYLAPFALEANLCYQTQEINYSTLIK